MLPHRHRVAAIIASAGIVAVTLGMTYPLLSLVMESRGFGPDAIGLNAAMTGFGLIASAPLVPWLAARVGQWPLVVAGLAVTAATLLLFPTVEHLWAWHALRFALGVAINLILVLSEVWLNEAAPDARRGRLVGVYTTVLSAGFALGPALIPLAGIDGYRPFLVAVGFVVLATPVLWRLRRHDGARPASPGGAALGLLRTAPLLFVSVAAFGVFDSATLSLWPVFALDGGLSQHMAAFTLSALIAGNIVLQLPIGWLADRVSARAVLVACATGTALLGLALCWLPLGSWLLWPLLVAWGGLSFGTYTVVLTLLGRSFSGPDLVAGTAGFAAMWGLGVVVGPAATGAVMAAAGAIGLPLVLALLYALLAAGTARRTLPSPG